MITDEEMKEIVQDITKYGEGIVGQHARRLVTEVQRLKEQLARKYQDPQFYERLKRTEFVV